MKKCKKVLSLVLALLMLLSVISAGLVSGAVNKKTLYVAVDADNNPLKNTMNQADKYELTNAQYATMILDFADKSLAEANISSMTFQVSESFIINIDPSSINGLIGTILFVKSKLDQYGSLLGDVGKLNFDSFSDSSYRDSGLSATTTSDTRCITSIVSFLKNNKSAIGKIVRYGVGGGSNQLSAGSIVNGFLSDVSEMTSDIVGLLKDMLGIDNFDTGLVTMIQNIINGMDVEMLEGFTYDANDTIYTLIDKAVKCITNWAVKNLHDDTWHIKDNILSAMPTFETDYPFIILDNIKNINWDWEEKGCTAFTAGQPSTYLVYYINDLIGTVVNTVIPSFNNPSDPDYTGGWTMKTGADSLNTLKTNIANAAQFADIKLNNGGTFTKEEAAALTNRTKTYAMVLADAMLKMFFPSLKVEKEDIRQGNICKLAVQALNEFFCYYIPEKTITKAHGYAADLYTYDTDGTHINGYYTETVCKTLYKQMLARVIAKFVSGYFPVQSGKIEFTDVTSIDDVLKDIVKYFMNVVCQAGDLDGTGALGTIGSGTVYSYVDKLIFSVNSSNGSYIEGATSSGGRGNSGFIPEGFLPSAYNTTTKVKDLLFSCVENLDVAALLGLLVPNQGGDLNTKLLPNVACYEIARIVNIFFSGTFTSKPSSLDNDIITNDKLASILESICGKLDMNYHIYPALKLVANITGLASAQTRGDAAVGLAFAESGAAGTVYSDINPIISSSSSSIPANSYYIKVKNTSKGINGGYHNAKNAEVLWIPYKLQIQSIVCENDTSVSVTGVNAEPSKNNIESDSEKVFGIVGPAESGDKVLCFRVTYCISEEDGGTYCPAQETRLYVYLGAPNYATLSSNSVTAKFPATIYGSPSMFNNTVAYAITSNTSSKYTGSCEDTGFPEISGFRFGKASDIGVPTSTAGTQYKPFSVSAPSNYASSAGTYTIQYKLKTKNSADSNAVYGDNSTKNINWVLFDDAGLPSLVSKYQGMDLQQADFSNSNYWTAFQNELLTAIRMVSNPEKISTSGSTLASNFKTEVETLTKRFNNLQSSSTADYTEALKSRMVEYEDGDAENDVRALYTRWDYTPVSYTRFADSMSVIKNYYNKEESSSIKVTEALRYSEKMAGILFSRDMDDSLAEAKVNLQTIATAFDESNYPDSQYTPGSKEALKKALSDAQNVLNDIPLSGDESQPVRISDYADARSAILSSLNQLTLQPLNVSDLQQLIATTRETYTDNIDYTDEAWDGLLAALQRAEDEPINDPFKLLPSDYETADATTKAAYVAAANNLINTEYIPAINAAVQHLLESPFVSTLIPQQTATGTANKGENVITFKEGDKYFAGANVVDASKYIILPYGAKGTATEIKKYVEFTKNTSRYNYTEKATMVDGQVVYEKVYNTKGPTIKTVELYQDGTFAKKLTTASMTNIVSGNGLRIVDSDNHEYKYTVAIVGNANSSVAVTKANFSTSKANTVAALKNYLPNIVNGIGTDAIPAHYYMACDLNYDGTVDNSDLIILKMWEAGKYVPFNQVGVTSGIVS